jgi:ferredoxin
VPPEEPGGSADAGYSAQVDAKRCMGTGACELLDPEHFQLNDRNRAEWHAEAGPLTRERLIEIANSCPQGAISVVDADGVRVDP